MSLDERLTRAAHHIADGVAVPMIDPESVRSKARTTRRRSLSLATAVSVLAVIVAMMALLNGRDIGAPLPASPVPPSPATDGPTTTPTDLPTAISDLPPGPPPVSPFWLDGILYFDGKEIPSPFPVGSIEVAGGVVVVTELRVEEESMHRWALLRGDRFEPIPATTDGEVELSVDGRIAYWTTRPTATTSRFVAWDTETNQELASRELPVQDTGRQRVYFAGIDADGIGYWYDETSAIPITAWNVREDTATPRPDLTNDDLDSPRLSRSPVHQFVSPDGTREVFTGTAAADPPPGAGGTPLGVRGLGTEDSTAVVWLRLPQGIPGDHLWEPDTDEGTLGVWWETNQTLLIETNAYQPGNQLLRCYATDGDCERISQINGIDPGEPNAWGSPQWVVARGPGRG